MKIKQYCIHHAWAITLCLCVMLSLNMSAQRLPVDYKDGVRQGRVVVKFKNDPNVLKQVKAAASSVKTKGGAISFSAIPKLEQVSKLVSVNAIKPLFQANPKFESRFKKEGLDLWYTMDYSAGESPWGVVEALKGVAEIQVVEPDFQLIEPKYKLTNFSSSSIHTKATQPVNDPMFPDQWHYNNTGQTGGLMGADVNLIKAWQKRMTASNVIVAIMDQGVDASHEDLAANMWINEKEYVGTAGVDDDGNGLIDDVYGFDFGNGIGQIEKGEHGTHVAGTVAAVTNNKIGVSGVAGGDGSGNGARIMTLPVFGANQERAANSYIYAADNGALISQNSWGYSSPGMTSEAYEEAIKYFIKYAGCDADGNQLPGSLMKGGVVIFASGNTATTGDYYPGCLPEVLAVASVTHNNLVAPYSTYGPWVDVACYGGDMSSVAARGVLSTVPGNQYGYMEGTSMACPHVSGIAALALAELGGSGFTETMLKNYLTLTVRPNEDNYVSTYKGMMGRGIVDAVKSMTKNDGIPPKAITDAVLKVTSDSYVQVGFTAPSKEDGGKVEGYRIAYKAEGGDSKEVSISQTKDPGQTELLLLNDLKPGTKYTLHVYSFDIWGVNSLPSNELSFITSGVKGIFSHSADKKSGRVDYSTSKFWEFDVEIQNIATDESAGGISWRADGYKHTHRNSIPIWGSQKAMQKAKEGDAIAMPFTLQTETYATEEQHVYEQAGYKSWITYRPAFNADKYVGESKENGIMHPTSAAAKFVVPEDYKDGFSLTNFDASIRVNRFWMYDDQVIAPTKLRIDIEIYRGGEVPRIENRIYSGYFIDLKDESIHLISLPFKAHFDPKETFWIVIHADSRYMYPFGVSEKGTRPEYSYYSSDKGKTWTQLSKVYNAVTDPVFTIAALSDGTGGKSYMTLTPSNGFLAKGEKQILKARVDLQNVQEGMDTTLVVFNTDGTMFAKKGLFTAALDLKRDDVSISFNNEMYEYGMVSQGDKKSLPITIRNKGMGHLSIDQVALTNTNEFKLVTKQLPKLIAAGDSAIIEIEFTPLSLGAINSELKVTGRGRTETTLLLGTCVEAPKAEFNPQELKLDVVGAVVSEQSITIENTSNYALSYQMPQFIKVENAKGSSEIQEKPSIERTDTTDIYTGYTWVDNHMEKAYQGSEWVEISETGTELTYKCDGIKKFTKVKLPFAFKYYDKNLREIYVGVNGMLRCDTVTHALNVPAVLPYDISDNTNTYKGIIAPLWVMDGTTGHFTNTHFYYQALEDCIIFQFTGTIVYMTDQSIPCNYQIALYPDGHFEMRYKKMFEVPNTIANSFMVGWSSPDGTDGKTIYYLSKEITEEGKDPKYCIRVSPPVYSPFITLPTSKYSGVVPPLGQRNVTFNVDPSGLPVGTDERFIKIITSDPTKKETLFPITFNKTDKLSFEFSDESKNYGAILFGNTAIEKEFDLFNSSKTDGLVKLSLSHADGVSFANAAPSLQVTVKNNSVKSAKIYFTKDVDVDVYAQSEDGSIHYDTLKVKISKLAYYNFSTNLSDKKELVYDLSGGEKKTETVKITADDKTYKSKLFLPGFMTVEKTTAEQSMTTSAHKIDFAGYRWMNSNDAGSPQFIWEDLSKTGTRLALTPDLEYAGHQLPFKFPFYGMEYEKLYLSPNGRISPFPLGWDIAFDFVPPVRLPDSNVKVPLVSAMWARQWYDEKNKQAGIYYDINSERAIFQYHQFQFDWITTEGFTSYQMIFYKDGTIQFVYLDLDNCDLSGQVTLGMQGRGGATDMGYTYTLTSSPKLVKSRTTITAKPMYGPYVVEKNQSLDLKFTANSAGFKAGEYKEKVLFVSDNSQVVDEMPVNMKVSASSHLTSKEPIIDFGNVTIGDKIEPKVITLMNGGNQDITVSAIKFEGDDADIFEIKKQIAFLENGEMNYKYEDIVLPLAINAFSNEILYIFLSKPKQETKESTASLLFEGSSNKLKVEVKAHTILPATIKLVTAEDESEVNVSLVGTTQAFMKPFNVKYEVGVNPLDFDLALKVINEPLPQPQRAAAKKVSGYGPFDPVVINSKPIPASTMKDMKPLSISTQAAQPYGMISVIGDAAPEVMIGAASVGEHYGFGCYVKMNTDDAGFLMSHVRMYTNTLGRDTSAITIRIYEDCKLPAREHLLYEKDHRLKMNVSTIGEIYVPLEHNIAFAPNQEFWVEVYFGAKLQTPIAVASVPKGVDADRNYYRLFDAQKETWSEFYQYQSLFTIWAVQESYSDLTKWLTLSTDKNTLNPGETTTGDMKINTLHFPVGNMSVSLTATSKSLLNVTPLTIHATKFVEPQWTIFPSKSVIIKEGAETSFIVKAEDPNNQPIDYRLTAPVEGVKLTKQADGSLLVDYKAPYTARALSNLNIEARTKTGVSIRRIAIGNINVNRAPIALSVKPITLSLHGMNAITLPVSYFFVDPDNDALMFKANISSDAIGLNLSERGFIFTPLMEGSAEVVIITYDGEFEVTNKFRVNVIRPLNNPPTQIKPFLNVPLETGKGFELDLSEYFMDQEGDSISYEAWATNPEVAIASVKDSTLSVVTLAPGFSAIAIKARDSKNGETLASFTIKATGEIVLEPTSFGNSLLSIAPNPAKVESTVTYSSQKEEEEGELYCHVSDLSGRSLLNILMEDSGESSKSVKMNLIDFKTGVYLVSIVRDGKIISTEKLVVTD